MSVVWFPAWSPDGKKMAVVSVHESRMEEIYVVEADGSKLTRITDNNFSDTHPVWAPQ